MVCNLKEEEGSSASDFRLRRLLHGNKEVDAANPWQLGLSLNLLERSPLYKPSLNFPPLTLINIYIADTGTLLPQRIFYQQPQGGSVRR
jgi:hypothetical protein